MRKTCIIIGLIGAFANAFVAFAEPMHVPVVAVEKIDDNAGSGQAATLSQMILTAVAATQKFNVIERGQMETLVREQVRARSGMVTSRNGGKIGGFQGADYLIYGTITTLSATKSTDFGATIGMSMLTGNRGQANNCYGGKVTLSLDIRITDAETGQIRYVKRIDEMQKAGTICGEGVPQANATALFRGAADKIATGLVTSVYPIKVANVQGDGTVMLNYGEGAVHLGDYLTVFRPGQQVTDPDTGRVLGTSEEILGILQITDVQNGFSKAKPVAGFAGGPPEPKNVARPSSLDDYRAYPKFKAGRYRQ